ncbi:MAG: triosephosphate isomerase, partial [Clostridia bacterium]|nr:triosephosphate isomerase [Clostridia bacterium]
VLATQIKEGLKGIEDLTKIVIAYEPVWAIGTGKTATSDQADEVCGIIRNVVAGLYDDCVAKATTIQYGGSMNAKNCDELLSKENVDGGLIGGASLKAPDFATIINAAL